jgi:putative endonuclease
MWRSRIILYRRLRRHFSWIPDQHAASAGPHAVRDDGCALKAAATEIRRSSVLVTLTASREGPRMGPSRWYGLDASKQAAVYILASRRNGTLYIGVTSELDERIAVHKQGLIDGFTKMYRVHRLVYVEYLDTMNEAIAREKKLKRWRRAWKIELIEKDNPTWRDLFTEITGLVELD